MRNKIPGIISTFWVILNVLSIVPINNADTIPTKTEITGQKWILFLISWISLLLYEYFRFLAKD